MRKMQWLSRVAEELNDLQRTQQPMINDEAVLNRLNRIIELIETIKK